jgi:membrane-anchored protein YejM (alkaline phosphatase superfamily)
MTNRFRNRLLRRLQLRESWIIFFIMGIIMLNFPFLQIFNKSDTLFGFPLLFIYFTVGWAISIFVIFLFTLAVDQNNTTQQGKKEP